MVGAAVGVCVVVAVSFWEEGFVDVKPVALACPGAVVRRELVCYCDGEVGVCDEIAVVHDVECVADGLAVGVLLAVLGCAGVGAFGGGPGGVVEAAVHALWDSIGGDHEGVEEGAARNPTGCAL